MEYFVRGQKIRPLQLEILKIAIEFDRICRKHKIKYIIDCGSLIGAARHQGFIPWDDDFDVTMLRKDYKKFLKVAKKELSSEFILETTKLNKHYPYDFGKIKLRKTVYKEIFFSKLPICHGVYMDIFIVDNTFKSIYKFQYHITNFFKYLRWKKLGCNPKIHPKTLKLFSFLPLWLINFCAELSMRFFNFLPCKYVYKISHPAPSKPLRLKKDFLELTEIEFENHSFLAPLHYDAFLRKRFGDYMIPPPIKQQVPSHNNIDLKL